MRNYSKKIINGMSVNSSGSLDNYSSFSFVINKNFCQVNSGFCIYNLICLNHSGFRTKNLEVNFAGLCCLPT